MNNSLEADKVSISWSYSWLVGGIRYAISLHCYATFFKQYEYSFTSICISVLIQSHILCCIFGILETSKSNQLLSMLCGSFFADRTSTVKLCYLLKNNNSYWQGVWKWRALLGEHFFFSFRHWYNTCINVTVFVSRSKFLLEILVISTQKSPRMMICMHSGEKNAKMVRRTK